MDDFPTGNVLEHVRLVDGVTMVPLKFVVDSIHQTAASIGQFTLQNLSSRTNSQIESTTAYIQSLLIIASIFERGIVDDAQT